MRRAGAKSPAAARAAEPPVADTGTAREEAQLRRWAAEPGLFVRQVLGATPDPWQDDVLAQWTQHDRIAILGSKGCAKTCLEAWLVLHTLMTQPHCKVPCVSISGDQLRDGLWAELAKWHGRSALLKALFHWSVERVVRKTSPSTWFAAARTFNRDADPNTQSQSIAGLHEDRIVMVIDEAGGVPPSLLATADAVLANQGPGKFARVLIGGNTTSIAGALYLAATKQRKFWHLVHVTSDPDDPKRTPRVSKEWARQQIDSYGRDNPWVKINVFAEFPETAIGKLLSLSDLEAAAARKVEEDPRQPLVLGVDVGMVTDAAVIYPRRGRLLYEPEVLRGASTIVIAGQVTKMARELGAVAVFVDAGGPGIGVVDQLRALGQSCVPVYFGGAADDSQRYANKRTEMHGRLADWIKEGGAIGRCTELVQDLLEPEVGWNLKGQQILEPKEEVKARLGRSPDWGDGAGLTFAYPVAAPPVDEATQRQLGMRGLLDAMRQHSHDEFGFGGG